MSLLDQMTAPAKPEARGGVLGQIMKDAGRLVVSGDETKFSFARGEPVRMSPDLARVRDLPRRNLNVTSPEPAKKWTALLKTPAAPCDCAARWGYCINELLPIQGVALEEANTTGSLVGLIGVGHGKALALDTKIPTPGGFTTMGMLRVGDKVFDSAGRTCTVTYATETQLNRECFVVRFSDGSSIIADKDHRWLTRSYLERRSLDRGTRGIHAPRVRTTGEIRESLFHRHNRNHSVDTCGALDLPDVALALDPYLLGVWLGDGSTGRGEITSADPDILTAFAAQFTKGAAYPSGAATTQTFLDLYVPLRAIGVLNEKHVPGIYLRASIPQRLALLQGLMDSDGCSDKDGTVEFCNTNIRLAEAVFELAASLGEKPTLRRGRATLRGVDCGVKYRVGWTPTQNVFRLARKIARLNLAPRRQPQIKKRRYIVAVDPVPSVPVRCITVDSPDHSYLCGEAMIPTHNTGLDILLPMVIPGVRIAVLLVPPKLRHQFLTHDFPQWSVHFRTPNLAGGNRFVPDGRPVLHLIAYSELSLAKNSDILSRLRPDLVIADEAHNLKDPKSARTKRFNRGVEDHVKFIPMSGTLTTRSPKDCAHLFAKAMHDKSPFPLHYPTVDEWSGALEASPFPKPLGALEAFCRTGEDARTGFQRRLIETPGVVATSTASIGNSLNVTALTLAVPGQVANLIDQARKGMRPDGEEAADQLTAAAWARQLSAGFYHRWIYPRGEPEELITQWFNARKAYYKETREKLKYSRDFLDSPLLLWRAAHRWHMGYTHNGEEFAPKTKRGPLPTWASEHWEAWRTIHKEVQPETDVVWVDDFLIRAAVEWGKKNTGIIWTEHSEFGARVAAQLGTVWYNGGGLNPETEKGDRTIVASIKANSDGLNLQRAFSRNLMVSVPSSGKTWEQMLGRTHRQGQLVDEVEAEVFLHTESLTVAFLQARRDARYQQNITGSPQKLCYANLNLRAAADATEED